MKKGLSKLILSGAAVAAVAATLGTSTYAWYTTNPTVSANDILGASSDTGSSSIFISKDSATKKTWSAKVTFTKDAFGTVDGTSGEITEYTSNLIPVQYANTGTFKAKGEASAAAHGSDVAKFTLYFRSSKISDSADPVSLYIKDIDVYSKTTTYPEADNLAYGLGQTTLGVASGSATYAVDFRNALSMAVYNADTTNGYDKTFTVRPAMTGSAPSLASGSSAQVITSSTAKAQEYYDYVMATMQNDETKKLSTAEKTEAGAYARDAIAVLPKNGTDYATIDFYVYLDGASQYCYDACQGQEFEIDITFTSDSTAAWNNA